MNIKFGIAEIDGSGDNITHNVTNIYVDSQLHLINFIIEKGLIVKNIQLTINQAEELEILNLQNLSKFLK